MSEIAAEYPVARPQVRIALGHQWPPERQIEFVSIDVGLLRQTVNLSGLSGSRATSAAHLVDGPQAVRGALLLEPTLDDLLALLPYVLGGQWLPVSPSQYACTLTESLPDFLLVADRPAEIIQYAGCKFVLARFVARCGALLRLDLGIEGLTASQLDMVDLPVASDLAAPLTLQSAEIALNDTLWECAAVELTIENVALLDRYANSLARLDLPIVDRTLVVRCHLARHSSAAQLTPGQSILGSLSLRLSSGGDILDMRLPNVRFVVAAPATNSHSNWGVLVEGTPGATPDQPELIILHMPQESESE